MKTAALLPFPLLLLTGNLLCAQIVSNSERARQRYEQRIAAAEKMKNDGIAKLTASFESEVKLAQDEVKRAFEPLIRSAAMRNQTEEVRNLTLQMESILNPDGVIEPVTDPTGTTGTDFKQLAGRWKTADSRSGYERRFEFKPPRTVLYSYSYSTSGGGKVTQTEEWKAITKPDKIIIERRDSRVYPTSYKEWYEIALPFQTDSLEITRRSEGDGRSSNESFVLEREDG